jgi:quercetin dioxygenase-like cupin family protein
MVTKGTILRNSQTGETAEFLETRDSSGGKHAKVKWNFKPDGIKPATHIHVLQDETFEVISGSYAYELNGEKSQLNAGESKMFPKNVAHTHFNGSDTDCVAIQTVSPALDFEDILARLFALNEQGKIKNGEPPLLEVMIWIQKYEAKTYLAKIPVGVQNAMSFLLAPLGRMLGYGGN